MLHDFDRTLENLLRREGRIAKDDIDIAFDQPTREWSARLSRPALNLWAFDIRENLKLRQLEMSNTPVENHKALGSLTPFRIDVTYLVTAWARNPTDEHQLVWRALATFKQFRNINPSIGEGSVRAQQRLIPLMVADMSEARTQLSDLWSVMDNQMHLGFLLTATLELDAIFSIETPLVLQAELRFSQANSLHAPDKASDSAVTHRRKEGDGDKPKP